MRRLARAFVGRLSDKYPAFVIGWLIYGFSTGDLGMQVSRPFVRPSLFTLSVL